MESVVVLNTYMSDDIVSLDDVRKQVKATKKHLKKLKDFDLGDLLKCEINQARKILDNIFPEHTILEVLNNDTKEKQLLIKGPKLNCVLTTRNNK